MTARKRGRMGTIVSSSSRWLQSCPSISGSLHDQELSDAHVSEAED